MLSSSPLASVGFFCAYQSTGRTVGVIENFKKPRAVAAYVARGDGLSSAITGMLPVHDGLLVGFGDWAVNGGPVPLIKISHDSSESIVLDSVPTESISCIKVVDGDIHIPFTDPRDNLLSSSDGVAIRIAMVKKGDEWVPVGNAHMIHCFDVTSINGELFYCGSVPPGNAAVVSESGKIFKCPDSGPLSRFYRFYDSHDGARVYNPSTSALYAFDGDGLVEVRDEFRPVDGLVCGLTGNVLSTAGPMWRIYGRNGVLREWFTPSGAWVHDAPTAYASSGEVHYIGWLSGRISVFELY